MQQTISLKLLPSEAANDLAVKNIIAKTTGKKISSINGYHILKQSIDPRAKTIWTNLTVNAFMDERFIAREIQQFGFRDVGHAKKREVSIGAGPAGSVADVRLIEQCINLGM